MGWSEYSTEQWTEYCIGMAVFILRFFARWRLVGVSNLAWDDFFVFVAMLLWTVDSVTVQLIVNNGSIVGLNAESAALLTDEEAVKIETGSKALFIAWLSYTTLIWSLKASLLIFYRRLTLGLWQQKLTKVMSVVCAVAYTVVILTLFLHCTPIQLNWQAKPYPGDKCAVTVINYIVVATLNVITDAGILAIPLPLIWKVKIPLRRKIIIAILLSSGVFVIAAAILRCVLTLISVKNIGNSTIWGIRETFVSLIAISAPAIKSLFVRKKPIGSSGAKNTDSGPYQKFNHSKSQGLPTIGSSGNPPHIAKNHIDLEANDLGMKYSPSESDIELESISRNASQDHIVKKDQGPLEVQVTTAVTLSSNENNSELQLPASNANFDGSKKLNPFRNGTAFVDEEWNQRGNTTQISVGHAQKIQGS